MMRNTMLLMRDIFLFKHCENVEHIPVVNLFNVHPHRRFCEERLTVIDV
jgi:hypothetical protein